MNSTKITSQRNFKYWSNGFVLVVLLTAVVVVCSWQLDIEIFKRPIPTTVAMNPLTALLFIFLSFSFFILTSGSFKGIKLLGYGFVIVVLLLACYKLIGTAFHFSNQIDEILFAEKINDEYAQNRSAGMPLNAVVNFIFVCLSMLFIEGKSKGIRVSQMILIIVLLLSLFSILGYIYKVPEFYGVLPYFPMAVHTSISFFIFSIALLLAKPHEGLMESITSPYSGSFSAKILIPCIILIPLLLSYLPLWGHWKGVFSTEFGIAIQAVIVILIFGLLMYANTYLLNKRDQMQKSFTDKLESYNVQLNVANNDKILINDKLNATLKALSDANRNLVNSNEQLNSLNIKIEEAARTIQGQNEIIISEKNDELNHYRQNLDIIFSNTQEGVLLLDRNGKVVLFNKTFKTFIESVSTKQPAVGKSFMEVVVDARKEAANDLFIKALNGKTSKVEADIQGPEGMIIHSLSYEPIWQGGEVTHVCITSSDITSRKTQENIIRQSEANLKSIFENTLDSFLLLSHDFKIMAFNQVYSQQVMLQTNRELKLGENIMDYIVRERRESFALQLKKVENGEVVQYDTELRWSSQSKWFHISITQVKGDSGEFFGYCIGAQDKTEVKKAELELRRSEERFRAIVENSDDIFVLIDDQGNIFYASPSFTRILGYNKDEIKVLHQNQVIHPDDVDRYSKDFEQIIKNPGKLIALAFRVRHKDGRWLRLEGTSNNLLHVENVKGIIVTYRDVTSRHLIAKEFEKLSLVASNTHNPVLILDKDGCIEWVNQGFTKLTEYVLDEVKGLAYISFLKQTDKSPYVINLIDEKMKRFESISVEAASHSKSGREYWIRLDITPVFDDKGTVKNYVSVKSDISSQKLYEIEITAIARELGSLIENSNVPIFGVDLHGYINEWNSVTVELTQFTKNEVLEKKWVENFIEPSYKATLNKILEKVLAGNPVSNFELPILTKDLKRKTLLLSLSPRWSTTNTSKGVIIVAQDITELTEYRIGLEKMVQARTHELNEALKKEKELVEIKSKFVSIASHEFKIPLNAIARATEFIRKNVKTILLDVHDELDNIDRQVGHMDYLLEDVLTISKTESGKVHVNLSKINMDQFFRSIAQETYESTNKSHQIRIKINCAENVIVSDARMVRIILVNLLTNAIKFSPTRNYVDLKISVEGKLLTIEVTDEGLGIPEDDMENIFTSFHRGSNADSIQGTGLGLSIVKKTVDLLSGTVSVKSKEKKGSTFTISIPIESE